MTDILYAAPLSLYSGKARAYMDWKNIDYREQLAHPEIYRDIIIPAVGRPVMPVVQSADAIIQDTTLIIDHYEAITDGPSIYPDTPKQKLAALLLETFGDEWLVIPAMHYRWNYNEEWVYGEFGKVALPDGDRASQYAMGKERGANFRGFVPMLGINEVTIPAIEKSYEALLGDLNAHFTQYDYLLGSRPSIGDFGLIGPLYAHLYRDPASGEIMERLAPKVAAWVRRMVNVETPLSGDFLPDDAIPETLLPVLKRMMDEHIPYLQNTANMLTEWAQNNDGQNADTEIPRAIGMTEFTVEGIAGQRIAIPFSLWMLQRSLDHYASLADKASCDVLIEKIDGLGFKKFQSGPRLKFTDYKISIA